MSTRAAALAAAVALISLVGIAVLGVHLATRGGRRAALPAGFRERAAEAPFAGFRATGLRVSGRCRPVAVADTESLREQGLRGHDEPGRWGAYAGMLFVAGDRSTAAFTMAGVTAPLEISWYSSDGKRVDSTHLAPCPDRDESHCPIYRSRRPYRVALETAGGFPAGARIAPCGG